MSVYWIWPERLFVFRRIIDNLENPEVDSAVVLEEKNCAKLHIRPLYVNFGGGHIFVFCLVPSVAQLSSASFYFLCFPAAAYVHLDAWCDPYCIVEVDNFLFGLFPSVAQLSLAQPFIITAADIR